MELLTALLNLFLLFYLAFIICRPIILGKRNKCCYMLHYECFKPPEDRKLDSYKAACVGFRNKRLGIEELRFLIRTISSSGIGESPYLPKSILEGREERPSLENDTIAEVDEIMFDTLDKLFRKSGVSPLEIDILVVNVSCVSVAPSFTSRVVNRYKMRHDIKTFNFTAMGCSASVIAVDLVQHLFKVYRNVNAIVVSTESIGTHWYVGKERSFMLPNCLFRVGGSSLLLTNKRSLKHRALLKLNCIARTHIAADDKAYKCCYREEDVEGNQGVRLTRHLPKAAAQGLAENLKVLVPKFIPLKEIMRYLIVSRIYSLSSLQKLGLGLNLKTGVQHFCVHPGGKAVLDGIGKNLQLTDYDLEPSKMTLHRWGNTSSAGFWYVLGYMEAKKRLKKGDKIFMVSFGAGFKCNTCLWEVMKKDLRDRNVWDDCIDEYPPKNPANPLGERYGWIFDESFNFVRLR